MIDGGESGPKVLSGVGLYDFFVSFLVCSKTKIRYPFCASYTNLLHSLCFPVNAKRYLIRARNIQNYWACSCLPVWVVLLLLLYCNLYNIYVSSSHATPESISKWMSERLFSHRSQKFSVVLLTAPAWCARVVVTVVVTSVCFCFELVNRVLLLTCLLFGLLWVGQTLASQGVRQRPLYGGCTKLTVCYCLLYCRMQLQYSSADNDGVSGACCCCCSCWSCLCWLCCISTWWSVYSTFNPSISGVFVLMLLD